MPTVKDIMSSPVKTIQLTAQVKDIIDFFKLNQISGAPVVNDKGFAVGLISRTNLVSGTDFEGKTARDIMTPFVFEITPDKDVLDVAKSMADANIRRVIVTENEVPVGVVTALDVVKEYIKLRES